MPPGIIRWWAGLEVAAREIDALKQGMNGGMVPSEDGVDDKGRPYTGGNTAIRAMMRGAGFTRPVEPEFAKFHQSYREENRRLSQWGQLHQVMEKDANGKPWTLAELRTEHTLKPALKEALTRMQRGKERA